MPRVPAGIVVPLPIAVLIAPALADAVAAACERDAVEVRDEVATIVDEFQTARAEWTMAWQRKQTSDVENKRLDAENKRPDADHRLTAPSSEAWIDVDEAVRRSGVKTREAIYNRAKRGTLRSKHEHGRLLVRAADIAARAARSN